jgi:hypothetical protein
VAETVREIEEPAPEQHNGSRPVAWVVAAVAMILAAFVAVVAATSGDAVDAVVVEVPAGTSERLNAGEVVEVIGPLLHLEPGQALQVDNDDDRLHVVGTLQVAAGESVRQVFDAEGRYVVSTSLRSDGLVTILVDGD